MTNIAKTADEVGLTKRGSGISKPPPSFDPKRLN